jgi:hypothetical protein
MITTAKATSCIWEQKFTKQLRPARGVPQLFGNQVPVRPELPDLVVADRQDYEVQLKRLNRTAKFPPQVAHNMNSP